MAMKIELGCCFGAHLLRLWMLAGSSSDKLNLLDCLLWAASVRSPDTSGGRKDLAILVLGIAFGRLYSIFYDAAAQKMPLTG